MLALRIMLDPVNVKLPDPLEDIVLEIVMESYPDDA